MAEIVIPDALIAAPDVEFVLGDGTKIGMREPTGSDLTRALKMLPNDAAPTDQTFALMALVTTFNGKQKRIEDIRNLKLRALNVIMKEFAKLVEPIPLAPTPEQDVPEPSIQ